MRDLRFTYPESTVPTLDGFSLDLSAGRHVALVGPSGAGRSTLTNLLLRFWDFEQGLILLNGLDLRQYAAEDVSSVVGAIPQRPHLFNATIRENILLAQPEAIESELRSAMERAQLREFVEALPLGDATWVGERGVAVSAGQRTRPAALNLANVLGTDAAAGHASPC